MKLIVLIISFLVISCNGQEKHKIMTTEKFDIQSYKERKEKDPSRGGFIILEDGTEIHQFGLTKNSGASEIITPPKPTFYKIRKGYYESTNTLEYSGKIIGGMNIGIWQFFDDKGMLIKEIDEDKKLDGHDYHEALQFLEKEGWITIKTGQGRERFSLDYENHIWYVTIMSRPWNGNLETYYEIDANTLEILKKTQAQLGDE